MNDTSEQSEFAIGWAAESAGSRFTRLHRITRHQLRWVMMRVIETRPELNAIEMTMDVQRILRYSHEAHWEVAIEAEQPENHTHTKCHSN